MYGRKFVLLSDHKPLARIFGPKSGIPALAAARMQRWALLLAGYDYEIEHVKSEDNAEADCLSRLPCILETRDIDECYTLYTSLEDLPVTSSQITDATRKDPLLSKVYELTASGGPVTVQIHY